MTFSVSKQRFSRPASGSAAPFDRLPTYPESQPTLAQSLSLYSSTALVQKGARGLTPNRNFPCATPRDPTISLPCHLHRQYLSSCTQQSRSRLFLGRIAFASFTSDYTLAPRGHVHLSSALTIAFNSHHKRKQTWRVKTNLVHESSLQGDSASPLAPAQHGARWASCPRCPNCRSPSTPDSRPLLT